jgi:hypothetical protein
MSALLNSLLEDEEEKKSPQSLLETAPKSVIEKPPIKEKTRSRSVLNSLLDDEKEDVAASKVNREVIKNSAVQEAALRFVKERLGMTELSVEDAMDEFVEHFREFNVNELTAAGDYRYVTAAAADATKRGDEKAARRLSDYRLLYQTFNEMPSFSDGFWKATGDYAEGILKAPSTYIGLALPGVGKAGGVGATQALNVGVNKTLAQKNHTEKSRKG